MDNKKSRFSQPPKPLTEEQKEKLANKIMDAAEPKEEQHNLSKNRPITIRIPDKQHRDIEKIHQLTGLTKNAICIELLRVAINLKLKELDENR
jgi:hypothetical protein